MNKKIATSIAVSSLVLGISTSGFAFSIVGYGARGSDVKLVQEQLNRFGYHITVDGIYGPETQRAVRDFQSKYKLAVDGIVGPLTESKLAGFANSSRGTTPARTSPTNSTQLTGIIKYGMRGSQVQLLQSYLNRLGFKISADGIFGSQTLNAVKNFQAKYGLTVDGIVGPQTAAKLASFNNPSRGTNPSPTPKPTPSPQPTPTKPAPTPTGSLSGIIKYGTRGSQVQLLQSYLNRLGFKISVDGIFGSQTLNAVKNFQAKYGLTVDGIVGPKTAAKMIQQLNASQPTPKPNPQPDPKPAPPTPTPTPVIKYPEGFSRDLTKGSTGNDVKLLQSMLNEIGYSVGNADGIFGDNTLDSVINFQKYYDLSADGVAGVDTIRKIIDVDNQVKAVQGFYVEGKGGYGHGVGMTQYGMKGMAEAGKNYKEIIQYYYTGVNISKYNTDNVNVKIALSLNQNNVSFTSDHDYTLVDKYNNSVIYTYPANSVTSVSYINGSYVLTNNKMSMQIKKTDPIRVVPQNGAVLWHKGYKYAGVFDILGNGNNHVDLINTLNIESYLKGVIPAEVYPTWPDEALKSQILAARTYALRNLKANSEFDLYDDQRSQAYKGLSVDNSNVDKLIDMTRGEVVTYNGQLADTVYSASAGGYTVDSNFIWGGKDPVPYLIGKPDPYDHSIYATFWWNATISKKDISTKYPSVGVVLDVKVLDKYIKFERPTLLEIIGTKGKLDITGKDFMSKVGGNFKSDLYRISVIKK